MVRAMAGLLLAALLIRGITFGYPMLHIDEQFYLLVGDRMLHGAVPYVDIWDRKPVGLFILYAAIRLLGGLGVVQYQVVAMLFAAATALAIYRMARMIARPWGAFWAGVAYLLCLSGYQCYGGQAPVFFNLPMALAGLMLCRMASQGARARLVRGGLGVMALVGIALQIKYTALFEGITFGLVLMALGHRQGWSRPRLLGISAAWVLMALTPTLLAFGAYAAAGHGEAFAYANFQSIFARTEIDRRRAGPSGQGNGRADPGMAGDLSGAPHAGPAPSGPPCAHLPAPLERGGHRGLPHLRRVVRSLCRPHAGAADGAGRAALGRAWKDGLWYTALLLAVGIAAATVVTHYAMTHHGTRGQVEHVAKLIDQDRQGACVYINEGDPILYQYTHACIVTPYIFPESSQRNGGFQRPGHRRHGRGPAHSGHQAARYRDDQRALLAADQLAGAKRHSGRTGPRLRAGRQGGCGLAHAAHLSA
jgi:hypothetical protein